MNRRTMLLFLLSIVWGSVCAQEAEVKLAFENYRRYYDEARRQKNDDKDKAIETFRKNFKATPYRYYSLPKELNAQECLKLLVDNGQFANLQASEQKFSQDNGFRKPYSNPQAEIGLFLTDAFNQIWKIADACRKGEMGGSEAPQKLLKAILHYGTIEAQRPNNGPRFHASCFAIPTAAVNTYFCFLEEMDKAEAGEGSPLLIEAADMLKVIALQAWTQPLRNDETDRNVASIERFRNHVWWVGGNALAYRSLLPVAAMYRSTGMIDVLSEVCQRGISMTSQTTYNEAFWTEGFTADGAGWGHGKQCLIWGYPIDGTSNALSILNLMKGSPWAKTLSRENATAILNFLRGGSWYYYKGYRLPGLDRGSYVYNPAEQSIPYARMLDNVVTNWLSSFSFEEQAELLMLRKEAPTRRIDMPAATPGLYAGTRWFFNNDDLIKKSPDYHIAVNMASVRCDGLESAVDMADEYNFYPTDGTTLFQRDGNEYYSIMGGWDVTALPGVTAREGMDKLTPVSNWRGYCSKHNFAAGATDGKEKAVAGYIFEKMNASDKEGVNDKGNSDGKNAVLYGFKAHKAYFMLDDCFVALGAGVTNMQPQQEGNIRTTIDQTALTGSVYTLVNGKKKSLEAGTQSLLTQDGTPLWLVQKDKFAYSVLPQYTSKAFVVTETRENEWVKRNKENAKKKELPKNTRILRLWADHGQAPQNDTYGYVVYTGSKLPPRQLPFEVLRNDTLVQAICTANEQIVQAVFYPGNKGLKTDRLSLSASAPCALLLVQEPGKCTLSVADACMNTALKEIVVTLNGSKLKIQMPQGMLTGKSVTVTQPLL